MYRPVVRCLTLAALSAAALAFTGASHEVLARSNDVLSVDRHLDVPCTQWCVACLGGPGHTAGNSEAGAVLDAAVGHGWHSNCSGASDCSEHTCGDQFASGEIAALSSTDLFNAVSRAVLREDAATLRRLLAANPERFRYVAARDAVQVTDCDGDVIAHYPLAPALATTLED